MFVGISKYASWRTCHYYTRWNVTSKQTSCAYKRMMSDIFGFGRYTQSPLSDKDKVLHIGICPYGSTTCYETTIANMGGM